MLNNSMYTYKAAGPQIGVEKVILDEVCKIIGWDKNAGGTFAPGGSMTNFMGMLMARDAFNQKVRYEGVTQKMTIYTSKDSHYSTPKNAAFAGIGRDNVRYIPSNDKGEMDPQQLSNSIKKDVENGFHPILVNATAGTTVLGAFDSIKDISQICSANNLWLHVDGAYCLSLIHI